MHKSLPPIGLLLLLAGCAQAPAPRLTTPAAPPSTPSAAAPPFDVDAEAGRLRAALRREVPQAIVDTPAAAARWIALARAAVANSGRRIDRPQLLVAVDRNPGVQRMRIVLARADGSAWQDLGGARVSTGETGRRGYYLTPTGVFLHTDLILDWRAQGTFNENHIRGLGLKGMRVWDFGWQAAEKGWIDDAGEIRLLMHATDPAYLERRLGRPASKGCVRVPAAMNRFLDRHGILDADYERAAQTDGRFAALLAADRTPTPLAGDMLVVIDTSESLRPGA